MKLYGRHYAACTRPEMGDDKDVENSPLRGDNARKVDLENLNLRDGSRLYDHRDVSQD